MSDLDLGQHGGPMAAGVGVLAAAITGAVTRFFAFRREEKATDQAQSINTKLALIEQRLGDFLALMKLYGELAGRLAIAERDIMAAHRRMDDQMGKRP